MESINWRDLLPPKPDVPALILVRSVISADYEWLQGTYSLGEIVDIIEYTEDVLMAGMIKLRSEEILKMRNLKDLVYKKMSQINTEEFNQFLLLTAEIKKITREAVKKARFN